MENQHGFSPVLAVIIFAVIVAGLSGGLAVYFGTEESTLPEVVSQGTINVTKNTTTNSTNANQVNTNTTTNTTTDTTTNTTLNTNVAVNTNSSVTSPFLVETIPSELITTPYGVGNISNIDCSNGSFCLLSVSSAGWDYKLLKYDLHTGVFLDVSTQAVLNLSASGDQLTYAWNGVSYIIGNRGKLYKYHEGTSIEVYDFGQNCYFHPYLHRGINNEILVYVNGCGIPTNKPAKLGIVDTLGHIVFYDSPILTSQLDLTTIGWNGMRWLLAGKGQVIEFDQSAWPNTEKYSFRDFSGKFSSYSDLEPAGIIVDRLLWLIGYKTTDTNRQLAEFDRNTVTKSINQLIGFDGTTIGQLTGEESLKVVSEQVGRKLNIIQKRTTTDVSTLLNGTIYFAYIIGDNLIFVGGHGLLWKITF